MLSLTNPYILLGALITALGLFFGGYTKGRVDANHKWELQAYEQAEKARKVEQALQENVNEQAKKHQVEIGRIQHKLDTALDGLRNRPERLPETARINCAGSTGSELSGIDSQFLVRESARADEIRQALKTCYDFVDNLP